MEVPTHERERVGEARDLVGRLEPRAEALEAPPPITVLRAAALGEPVAMAQLTALYLQAFDNQPGISIPFKDLD